MSFWFFFLISTLPFICRRCFCAPWKAASSPQGGRLCKWATNQSLLYFQTFYFSQNFLRGTDLSSVRLCDFSFLLLYLFFSGTKQHAVMAPECPPSSTISWAPVSTSCTERTQRNQDKRTESAIDNLIACNVKCDVCRPWNDRTQNITVLSWELVRSRVPWKQKWQLVTESACPLNTFTGIYKMQEDLYQQVEND